jgi:hypothetical protein
MNIAVLFFGQLRWSELSNHTFKQNVEPAFNGHNVKYFAHFWEESIISEQLEKFKELYNPIEIIIEKQKTLQELKDYFKYSNPKIDTIPNLPSQFYSFHKAFLLMSQHMSNINFDCFIKTRTDLAYFTPFNLNEIQDGLYFRQDRDMRVWISDLMLVTKNIKNLKAISNIAYEFDEILQENDYLDNCYPDVPHNCHELVLAHYLNHMTHISVKNYSCRVDLARIHEK